MAKTWKIVLGLALALPMLAYVTGSLIAAGDEPTDRTPIEFVQDGPGRGDSTSPDSGPGKQTDRPGKQGPKQSGPDSRGPGNRGTGNQGPGNQSTQKPGNSGSPEVIKPRPRDLDDDDWDDDDDDDDDDDGDDDND